MIMLHVMLMHEGVTSTPDSRYDGKAGASPMLRFWIAKDSIDVGIEAHAPETDIGHELFGSAEFMVATKHTLDKGDTRVGAKFLWSFLAGLGLSLLVHEGFAALEQFVESDPKTFARF